MIALTGINEVHRIIIAIAIQVQPIDGIGIQISSIIGRDESAPFVRVIPGDANPDSGILGNPSISPLLLDTLNHFLVRTTLHKGLVTFQAYFYSNSALIRKHF